MSRARTRRALVALGLARGRPPARRVRPRPAPPARTRGVRRPDAPPAATTPTAPRPPAVRRALAWVGLAERPWTPPPGPVHRRILERRREVLAARRRRESAVTVSLALLLGLVAAGIGLARSPLLALDEIVVHGVAGDRADEVAGRLGVTAGTNLLDLDLAALTERVERLPWVHSAVTRRLPPSRIEVRVATREPVATVATPAGEWQVDADGVVLAAGPAPGTPRIEADVLVVPTIGDTIRLPGVHAAVAVHRALPAGVRDWVVAYSAPTERDVTATLAIASSGRELTLHARFGAPEQVPFKAATLATLVEDVVLTGTVPHTVDIRVPDHPVLVTSA